MVIINPVSSAGVSSDEYFSFDKHIDVTSSVVYQGDSSNIKARLWQNSKSKFFSDDYMENTPLVSRFKIMIIRFYRLI